MIWDSWERGGRGGWVGWRVGVGGGSLEIDWVNDFNWPRGRLFNGSQWWTKVQANDEKKWGAFQSASDKVRNNTRGKSNRLESSNHYISIPQEGALNWHPPSQPLHPDEIIVPKPNHVTSFHFYCTALCSTFKWSYSIVFYRVIREPMTKYPI